MFERVYGQKQIELAQAILSGKAPITCDTMSCHYQTLGVNAHYARMRREGYHEGRPVFVSTAYSKLWAEAVIAGKPPPSVSTEEATPVGGHKTI
jgi:hypothetical protein